MSKLSLIVLLLAYSLSSQCQSYLFQDKYYNQPILINPANCASDYLPRASISYEKQWLDISRAPASYFISGEKRIGRYDFYNPRMYINESKFRSLERVGLGAGLYSDNNGPFREMNFLFTYSYHIPIGTTTTLSFGISTKLNHYGVNNLALNPISSDDPLINFENYLNFNASTGIYLYHDEYFIGVSTINLFNTISRPMYFPGLNQVLYGIGGYRFRNENATVILEPSFTLKYIIERGSLLTDFHVKIYAPKFGWLSFSYINNTQLALTLALRIHKSYYFAYKYGGISNEMSLGLKNTHGVMLGINLGVNRYTSGIY